MTTAKTSFSGRDVDGCWHRCRHGFDGALRFCHRSRTIWSMEQPDTNEPGTGDPSAGTARPKDGGPSIFTRRGPFLIVSVTAVLVAGVIAFGFFTSDEEVILEAVTTTSEVAANSSNSIAYPLSYSEATAQGIVDTIEWGETCDTETGRLAVPDFFAPECMAPFQGDNGRSTSPGVGPDTIKIVFYQVADNDPIRTHLLGSVLIDDTGEQQAIALGDFMEYYREYYELYGRSIELVIYQSKGAANDEAAARADAQRIAEQIRPFAVIGGPVLTNAFAEELAARSIVCIDCGTGSTQWFKDRDPYLWSTDASGTQKQIHFAEFVQKQLAGKPAAFGGQDDLEAPRVYGHVYLDRGPESNLLAEQMTSRLEGVGAKPIETIGYTLEPEKMTEKATEIITKLKAAAVTTVIVSTDPVTPRELTRAASEQDYFPEWVVAAAPLVDTAIYGRAYVPRQWENAFGVSNRAARANPDAGNYRALYEWYMGRSPFADETIDIIMPSFAFLLEAIHKTGPNLTPETFAGAIRAVASKPATSQPFYRWGDNSIWEDGDYSGVEDATLFWWDVQAPGPDERQRRGAGLVRFGDSAKRYLPGEWPGELRLFVVEGSVTIFETVPAGEAMPDYPSPASGSTTQTTTTQTTTTQPMTTAPTSLDSSTSSPQSSSSTTTTVAAG